MEKLESGVKKLGLRLTQEQLKQFNIYYQELIDWNRRVNLTSVTDFEEVQIRHFLDSLTVTLVFNPIWDDKHIRVIDVGTGAGLPGIPLKIVKPNVGLVLLEATTRKGKFLNYLNDRLGLEGVEIIVGRAEEVARVSRYRERFDLVLSRAVAPLPALVELTLPFCAVGGCFIAQKKGDIDKEINSALRAIEVLGGSLRLIKEVHLEGLDDKRCLVVIDKVTPTTEKYPRRPGMPSKRPIL